MTESTWPDDEVVRLRRLWAEGLSCSQIAAACGVTRNAVISKVHRLGLAGRLPSIKASPVRPRLGSIVEAAVPKHPQYVHKRQCFEAGDRRTVSFAELRIGKCRWPFGDSPYRFCGDPTTDPTNPDCSYCAEHARLSYVPYERKVA